MLCTLNQGTALGAKKKVYPCTAPSSLYSTARYSSLYSTARYSTWYSDVPLCQCGDLEKGQTGGWRSYSACEGRGGREVPLSPGPGQPPCCFMTSCLNCQALVQQWHPFPPWRLQQAPYLPWRTTPCVGSPQAAGRSATSTVRSTRGW